SSRWSAPRPDPCLSRRRFAAHACGASGAGDDASPRGIKRRLPGAVSPAAIGQHAQERPGRSMRDEVGTYDPATDHAAPRPGAAAVPLETPAAAEAGGAGEPLAQAWVWLAYVAILGGLALADYYSVGGITRHVAALIEQHRSLRLVVYPGLLWMLMGALLILFRTVVWMFYRPAAPAPRAAPRLTVVIPAYNEGAMVQKSIQSVAEADYPHDRLEILVIDDGSRDDTWRYIQAAAQRYPGLVTALRHEQN